MRQPNFMKVIEALKQADHIYIIGDGGSASMADHFACDLLKGCLLPAISLCSNSAVITAIGNDYSFDRIYALQLEILFKPNDLLVIFTTSGNSPNLVAASLYANKVLLVSGNAGGKAVEYATLFYDLNSQDQQESEDNMSIFCHEVFREFHKK
jgi:D-sedoheptulose 7-phosphate isomerase